MTRTRKALTWLVPAAAIAGVSALPETARTAAWQDALLLPGTVATVFAWPEGAHSGAGASGASIWLMFGVIYAVSIAFWGALLYLAQRAWLAMRRAKE